MTEMMHNPKSDQGRGVMRFDPTIHIERSHYEQQELELQELKVKLAQRFLDAEVGHYAAMKENIRLKAEIAKLKGDQ